MRTIFGTLFLLLAAILVVIMSQLYLKSVPDPTVESFTARWCPYVVEGGPASLMFFLISGAIALSHLPLRDKIFQSLRLIWGVVFLCFALMLLYVQFVVFRDQSCAYYIKELPAALITILTLGYFMLALKWAGGRALGSVFLLISMGTISVLAVSLISPSLALSPYGYFTMVVSTILLTVVGAIEIGIFLLPDHESPEQASSDRQSTPARDRR